MSESVGPPVEAAVAGKGLVEIYRSVNGRYSWKITAVAVDDSEQALRAAHALALDLEEETYTEVGRRFTRRAAERQRAQ